jgi:tetratricopeptide (TPR) repeat protein/CHAT domain-containing protein
MQSAVIRPGMAVLVGLALLGCTRLAVGDEPVSASPGGKPPYQRLLQGEDAKTAQHLEARLAELTTAGRLAEALTAAEELAELRAKRQGADHYQAIEARWSVEAFRRVSKQGPDVQADFSRCPRLNQAASQSETKGDYKSAIPHREKILAIYRKALGEDHPHTATSYNNLADILHEQGRYAEAGPLYEKALAIDRRALGEDHPGTAECCNKLAENLIAQGRYAEAWPLSEKALAIRQKALGEDHPDTAKGYRGLAYNLYAQGRYAEAGPLFEKALSIRQKALGEEHPETGASYSNLALNFQALGQYAEARPLAEKALAIKRKAVGEDHPDTATSYNNLAMNLLAQGRYAEARPLFQKALAIYRKALGEEHPYTALAYNNLAGNLDHQGRYAEAQPLYEKALAIRRKALGEEHPYTATSCNKLAENLHALGRYAEAGPLLQKALAIYKKALGEDHPDTARVYDNLALNLNVQGRYARAEPLFQKALTIKRKALGEEHSDTATSYNNLAYNLHAQGRYAEAGPLFEKALAIDRKALGEEHRETARAYNNVAYNLDPQGRYAEARPLYEKALAINRKALGEEHHETALAYNNLAANLDHQGQYAEARPLYEKSLALLRKSLGEEHPDTAKSCRNLASNLNKQGLYADARPLYEKALAIYQKALGEEHPETAQTYNRLAANLGAQGRYAEAERFGQLAADCFARARVHLAAAGLDRATAAGALSPLSSLACVLARNGKTEAAWQRFEEGLARGTGDERAARLRGSAAERARHAELTARVKHFARLVEQASPAGQPSPEQKRRHDDLLTQYRAGLDDLNDFARQLEQKYGPAAGQVLAPLAIQAALAPEAALVGWLDLSGAATAADPDGEHWAFVLRTKGAPAVVRLRGSGPDGHWSPADSELPARLRNALQTPAGDWSALAATLRRQRLEPLADALAARDGLPAVKRLLVLPSPALAGVPVETFADGYAVSYALSGSLYAYLRQQPRPATTGLLALADPVFDLPARPGIPKPNLPPGGLLVTSVVAGGNAAKAGIKAGDVLLRYGEATLRRRADLKPLSEAADDKQRVAVTVWRDGKELERRLRPGKLGVMLATAPAAQALTARYEADRVLAKARGGDDGQWPALPGTRVEAEGLRKLFASGDAEPLILSDSEASEQRLYDLAKSGELGRYRYLHLATHGTADDRFPLSSAVILSRDHLPDPGKQLEAGLPILDGRLTAEEVLEQWHLNADLVTLSACQTALGKYENGEGFVGFAQALILAGSRSVCLSFWKVDDTATALLMGRFYENLLGKRDGLNGPMKKAEALAEAKAWLRGLSREEAMQRAAKMSDGVARGKRPKLPLATVPEAKGEEPAKAGGSVDRPYAHPYYWAAFVLIGDPG